MFVSKCLCACAFGTASCVLTVLPVVAYMSNCLCGCYTSEVDKGKCRSLLLICQIGYLKQTLYSEESDWHSKRPFSNEFVLFLWWLTARWVLAFMTSHGRRDPDGHATCLRCSSVLATAFVYGQVGLFCQYTNYLVHGYIAL